MRPPSSYLRFSSAFSRVWTPPLSSAEGVSYSKGDFLHFQDTVHFANMMNQHAHLDHRLQFQFLINIVRPKKRFAKWSKTEHHDDLEAVVQYFGYSYEKAKQVMDILSSQQIKDIKKKLEKGGLKK